LVKHSIHARFLPWPSLSTSLQYHSLEYHLCADDAWIHILIDSRLRINNDLNIISLSHTVTQQQLREIEMI